MKISKTYRWLVCASATVSVVCVILAGLSRLMMQKLGLTQGSYMSLATLAILFAIYFLVEGAVYAAKKG